MELSEISSNCTLVELKSVQVGNTHGKLFVLIVP